MRCTLQLCQGAKDVARARLQSVRELKLECCTINEGSGSLLPPLFPQLEALRLNDCQITRSFLSELAPLANLRCLDVQLMSCGRPGIDSHNFVEEVQAEINNVATLTNLQGLSLNYDIEEIDVGSLVGLQHLRELSLACFTPVNLHLVLASVPLRSLCFESVELPWGERYASSTLQTIFWDFLDGALPLNVQDFPSLQVFQFGGVAVGSGFDSWQPFEEKVAEIRKLAAWAQTIPSRACGHRSGAFLLSGSSSLHAAQVTILLRELLPMRSLAFDVGCVCLEALDLNRDGWSLLADLIRGLQLSQHPFPSLCLGFLMESKVVEAEACVREVMPYISRVVAGSEPTQTTYLDT
ncbi:hypothetical protein DUNSADRAFT_9279 [Dunaliella salina]|nr:hypothetical protein DUNSADRAFT_9279 [Dunaliella salina]|eukprot:KAF5834160.1 hypothetical protein DUNSADRAFT_9279 [Dunaliella salina]